MVEGNMIKKLTLLFSVLFSTLLFGQEYKFNLYDHENGLLDDYINTINQDENGYLIVGTGQGVGFYDGSRFSMKTTADGLVDNFISASFKDSKGNIWFGHNQGGITKYSKDQFTIIHPGDGISSVINGIQEDSKGNVWFSTQTFGLFCRDFNNKITFFNHNFKDKLISTFFIDESDYIFIGVEGKLEVYRFVEGPKGKVLSKIQSINAISDEVIKIIKLDDGRLLAATKTSGIFAIDQKEKIFSVTPIKISNLTEEVMIQNIYMNSGRLWISTYGSGVLRTILVNNNCFVSEIYTNKNGLNAENNIQVTFIDREDVLWIGTYGNGIYSKEDNFFTFYFRDKINDKDVSYLEVKETEIWIALRGKIECYDKQYGKIKYSYTAKNNGLPNDKITNFQFGHDSTLYVGTETNGLYLKPKNKDNFTKLELSDDILSNHITSIAIGKNSIWVGTQNGVYKINSQTKQLKRFSMSDGLSHNSVKNVFVSKNNTVYVGTNVSAFLNLIVNDEVSKIPFKTESATDYISVTVTKIIEDDANNIWVSSKGTGLFCFNNSSIKHYDTGKGLLNNYCYGVAIDDKDKIWVSHDGGISSLDIKTDKIEIFDSKYGLDTRFSISAIDHLKNEVWFGTQNGVVKYNSKEALKNSVPPITSLKYLVVNDELTKKTTVDTILPAGEHNLEFFYKGISLKNSKGLQYRYILEGYDENWSELTQLDTRKYTKVREGEYSFKVKSYNDDGVEGNMIVINVSIKLPFYKQWWFYFVLTFFIVAFIISIIKYRERQQRSYLKNLSNELNLRTFELVEQKEKMEEINKDLTDSINYAKGIQTAILPEEELVKKMFPKNFILFKPRDIVSGDFYWVTEYSGKKIIVFADCTGHGVPGGFMSMIGRILLRETCTVKKLIDPGAILKEIDKGLVNVLKQKDDIDSNKDGMDLGICVIDNETNEMFYAGAMRPLYIYRDGVRSTLKGNRYSVGGISQVGKYFDSQSFQLEKNDILYMFTDGYPDQFGGKKGRKMKISVLNELLDQVCQMPFEEQGREIEVFFKNWKRKESQMDDVLMIGVQI